MKRKMLVWFDPKKVTCASVGVVETTVVSTLKLFLITYLIVKFVVEPPLIPIEKSLFFNCRVQCNNMVVCIYHHVLGGQIGTTFDHIIIERLMQVMFHGYFDADLWKIDVSLWKIFLLL
jgi:hypothetical protein